MIRQNLHTKCLEDGFAARAAFFLDCSLNLRLRCVRPHIFGSKRLSHARVGANAIKPDNTPPQRWAVLVWAILNVL